jgi:uncharacterized protein YgiM (DUF1202 family)
MERPGLLEFAVYGLVIGGIAWWVFALPPFAHDPGSSRPADLRPVAAGATSGSAEPSEAEPSPSDTAAQSSEENSDVGQAAPASEAESPQSAQTQPDEQPRLDPQPSLLVVTATRLNMRSQPNSSSPLVGSYPRGALVEEVTTQGNWVLVRTIEDNSIGWMYAGHLGSAAEN